MAPVHVYTFMTPTPFTIAPDAPVGAVRRLMKKEEIRHVPIVDQGLLVGVISDRDVDSPAIEAMADGDQTQVVDVMAADVCVAHVGALVRDVVKQMEARNYDYVVLTDLGHVVGIFTAFDALRVVAELDARYSATG